MATPREVRADKAFGLREVDSIYVTPSERFVVSLVVGYSSEVRSAQHAAAAALELTRDEASSGTSWFVFDRKTGEMVSFEQSDIELPDGESLDDFGVDPQD